MSSKLKSVDGRGSKAAGVVDTVDIAPVPDIEALAVQAKEARELRCLDAIKAALTAHRCGMHLMTTVGEGEQMLHTVYRLPVNIRVMSE